MTKTELIPPDCPHCHTNTYVIKREHAHYCQACGAMFIRFFRPVKACTPRLQEIKDNIAWALSHSGCNCPSCQVLRAYAHDFKTL